MKIGADGRNNILNTTRGVEIPAASHRPDAASSMIHSTDAAVIEIDYVEIAGRAGFDIEEAREARCRSWNAFAVVALLTASRQEFVRVVVERPPSDGAPVGSIQIA